MRLLLRLWLLLLTAATRITLAFVVHVSNVPTINHCNIRRRLLQQRDHRSIRLLVGVSDGGAATEKDQLTFVSQANNFLASAFAALDEKDKYDTVLMGLCAKVLDGTASVPSTTTTTTDPAEKIAKDSVMTPTQRAYETLKDPIALVKEMNSRKVRAKGRSLIALVDVRSFLIDNVICSRCVTSISLYDYVGCEYDTRCSSHGNDSFINYTKW